MPLISGSPRTGVRLHRASRPLLLAGFAVAALLGQPLAGTSTALAQGVAAEQSLNRAAQGSLEKARAAEAKGEFRTAQIEYRNAVRADPNSGLLRSLLARLSLEIGDLDTAEKEARAAIERNYEPAQNTALLLRTFLMRGRTAELLREFPMPANAAAQPAVAAQIGLARVTAAAAAGDQAGAKIEFEALQRAVPNAAETHLAAATLAAMARDRAGVAAAVDKALAVAPDDTDALMRRVGVLLEANQPAAAIATLDRILTLQPNNLQARVVRGELAMRSGDTAKAQQDVEAALRVQPGSVPANFLRALLQVRAQDWRAADETLSRLGGTLANIGDGLLVQATVKRALQQTAQAMDAAQRYVARRPDDPRGAKLLAMMEMEQRQPAAAAGTMERLIQRGNADAESYDLYGRALMATGRPRDAVGAFEKVTQLAPQDAGAQVRLAAARLATGDSAGTLAAAQAALRLAPDTAGARELVIIASLARGDIATAEAEMKNVPAQARQSEVMGVADATLKIARLDIAGGRAGFEDVLKRHPDSTGAQLGLARLAARGGDTAEATRLWSEVARRDPNNVESLNGLALVALSGGPQAGAARTTLEEVQKAAPAAAAPALILANVLMRTGEAERALQVLDSEALRNGPAQRGAALHLMRAEANTALRRWPEAEAAARTAYADEPDNSVTRRALALATLRNGDARGAEELLQIGLRRHPGDALLQGTLVGVVKEARGLDAALAVADGLAKQPNALPAASTLRGDLLMGAEKPKEAAEAYAAAYAATPSALLALRAANAWRQANEPDKATAALESWVQREPNDMGVAALLAQLELQAGRNDSAERRLATIVERAPTDAASLNNLAWVLTLRGGPENIAKARSLAERAYFLSPSAEAADTLGWALVLGGEPQRGLPLLREAVASRRVNAQGGAAQGPDPGMSYRLAYALNATGDTAAARSTLEPILAGNAAFPERADAERLMATLRSGR